MPIPKHEYVSDVWKDGIFDNKVVFCTGGAGSICSAQVRALVHLGANACIVGRNAEKTKTVAADIATARKGAKVLGIGEVDVRSVKSLEEAVAKCVTEMGGVDFVVAGAAGNFLAPISALSANAFKSVIDIDVLGSYNTLKATLPHLVESAKRNRSDPDKPSLSTGGRIIFVSATLHYAGTPLQSHVSAAKAAIDALSNSVAIEYGPLGVTSNVIAPGPIAHTEGMERLAKKMKGGEMEAARPIPLGRWGRVREIADATVYLFGAAGGFVTGTIVVVDGGAWRMGNASMGGVEYPEFFRDAKGKIEGVKTGRREGKL